VCPYLFKMSYPFGVSEGERDYLAANTVHDVMSIALPTTVLENWQEGAKKFEWISIAEKIEKDSEDIVEVWAEIFCLTKNNISEQYNRIIKLVNVKPKFSKTIIFISLINKILESLMIRSVSGYNAEILIPSHSRLSITE
jgi:hypothetical protein